MFLINKLFGKKSEEDVLPNSSEQISSLSRLRDTSNTYNIILIGSEAALKRELLKILYDYRLAYKKLPNGPKGANFIHTEFELSKGNKVKLNIWDITGKEDFGTIVPQYCKCAHGILFYYTPNGVVPNRSGTFNLIKTIVERNDEMFHSLKIPFYLVGIMEQESDKAKGVSQNEVLKLADKIGAKSIDFCLDNVKAINEMFKKFICDITETFTTKPSDKLNEDNNADLLPKQSSQSPPTLPPTEPQKEIDRAIISQKRNESPPSPLISIFKYEGPKIDVEVQRNEDGLFGNYKEEMGYGILCYNVSVLGNPRIGKSCLCVRCTEGKPNSNPLTKSVWMHSFTLPDDRCLRLRMVEGVLPSSDTDPRLESSYSHSHAVLLCYDITDRASFDAVKGAAAEVRSSAMRGAVAMVVGLRYDSNESCVCVPGSEGKALAERHGMHFRECSAKDNVGVQEILSKILLELQEIDSFALPICIDDANRMLPLSVSSGDNDSECEVSQPPSLLDKIFFEQLYKKEIKREHLCFGKCGYIFKFILIGDLGAGRTRLVLRYVDGTFPDSYISTIGMDFKIKTIRMSNGLDVKLQIWDISGHERFHEIDNPYYRGAHAALICFDVTDPEYFENIKMKWKIMVERDGCGYIPTVIVGTKCDLPPKVDLDAVREYADFVDVPFMLCSAKTGEGVNEVFEKAFEYGGYSKLCTDFCVEFEKRLSGRTFTKTNIFK